MAEETISTVSIDFTKKLGAIKPMNAGNNGPKMARSSQVSGNFSTFKMLHVPYARVHDANLTTIYGAPHTIDVRAIFKNWDADPTDPASYDFMMTDLYLKSIVKAGSEPFYRLGGSIEHSERKWFTRVPEDFKKFAVICEHIIRHCTGDFANGLNLKITYWEIWNEADIDPDNSTDKRCWQGTAEQFRKMFCITFKHLKKCFPHLKIGGPASTSHINGWNDNWSKKFLQELKKQKIKLDFYSWHRYAYQVETIFDAIREAREFLDANGQEQAESILDEWNYVRYWGEGFVDSLEQENNMKGAAFALCTMLGAQKLPIDMLMYYDMRAACGMNGLWHQYTYRRQKPWYSFFLFDKLAQLGTEAASKSSDPEIQVVGAVNARGRKAAVIGYYTNDDNYQFKTLEIKLKGLTKADKENLSVRVIDEHQDLVEVPFELKGSTIVFDFTFHSRFGMLIHC